MAPTVTIAPPFALTRELLLVDHVHSPSAPGDAQSRSLREPAVEREHPAAPLTMNGVQANRNTMSAP